MHRPATRESRDIYRSFRSGVIHQEFFNQFELPFAHKSVENGVQRRIGLRARRPCTEQTIDDHTSRFLVSNNCCQSERVYGTGAVFVRFGWNSLLRVDTSFDEGVYGIRRTKDDCISQRVEAEIPVTSVQLDGLVSCTINLASINGFNICDETRSL